MRTVDLFSGCGGFSLGFEQAGFQLAAAYEVWSPAIETYRRNFKHAVHELDLSNADYCSHHIGQYFPEVIIGGPPCQDFSIANNKKSTDRANLTVEFARIVANLKPHLFVMENVYNIERSQFLYDAIDVFRDAGYGLTSRVIEACRVGVPQMRKRYFLIGHLSLHDDAFGSALDEGLSAERMTVRDHFGPRTPFDFYYAHPRNYKRRGIFSVDEPAATIRRVNRPIPATYNLHPADKAPVTQGLRPLTTRERAEIQTFPGTFEFQGSVSQVEQQIGNAVPVKLALYVAHAILKTLSESKNGSLNHNLTIQETR
ncbi:MAG: DNA cytosine methyltransferase [Sphingobium sp.]|nr:MAG: DNA cytosine methyltransferase [Sphingobium sp.]